MQSGFSCVQSHFNSDSTIKALRRASFSSSNSRYPLKSTHLSAKAYRISNSRFLHSYKKFALSKKIPVAHFSGRIEVGRHCQTASSSTLQGELEEGEEDDSSLV